MDSSRGVHIVGWVEGYERRTVDKLLYKQSVWHNVKSIDASDAVKDATLLFNLLDEVVEEVREDLVVQVVTDN